MSQDLGTQYPVLTRSLGSIMPITHIYPCKSASYEHPSRHGFCERDIQQSLEQPLLYICLICRPLHSFCDWIFALTSPDEKLSEGSWLSMTSCCFLPLKVHFVSSAAGRFPRVNEVRFYFREAHEQLHVKRRLINLQSQGRDSLC